MSSKEWRLLVIFCKLNYSLHHLITEQLPNQTVKQDVNAHWPHARKSGPQVSRLACFSLLNNPGIGKPSLWCQLLYVHGPLEVKGDVQTQICVQYVVTVSTSEYWGKKIFFKKLPILPEHISKIYSKATKNLSSKPAWGIFFFQCCCSGCLHDHVLVRHKQTQGDA